MGGRFRRLRLMAGTLILAGSAATAGVLATAGTAGAAGTLATVSWLVSNNEISATPVTYTFAFKTATAATIKTITMTVPSGTSGTPALKQTIGVGASTVALASNTLTLTVTTPATVTGGTSIELVIGTLTNTSTHQSFQSTITTKSTAGTAVDTAKSPAVTFATSDTVVTVTVAESTTFTNTTTSFKLYMDPALTTLATQSKKVHLTVKTNAANGFTLNVKDAGLIIATTTHQIAAVNGGVATAATWPTGAGSRFGYSATLGGGTAGSPTLATKLKTSTSDYAGYTTGGETILTDSGATGTTAVTLTLTNKVQIDYATAAGNYHDTITYTVTPSY